MTTSARDARQSVAVIIQAFRADLVARWFYPDLDQYLAGFPAFVRALGGNAFEHGGADHVEGFLGAALWLPPGVEPDEEALAGVLERTVHEQDHEAVFAFMEQMGEYHPRVPHWYLPLIGVDPAQQGKGFGSTLLKHGLSRCDRDQLPAYLEATSAESRRLYERHGFTQVGTIQVADSPPMYPMFREPR
jgi:ribosomal protein S18 acetylase RimI-like enzyme